MVPLSRETQRRLDALFAPADREAAVKGTRLAWPSRVPPDARYSETMRHASCVSGEFLYEAGRTQVTWSPDGAVLWECPFDRRGQRHGLEVSRFENGAAEWQVPWVRGAMNGLARQFDEDGRALYRCRFDAGTGVDLWVQGNELVEFREIANNGRHGLERWGHPRLPYEESHFLRGLRAGVFRRWVGSALEPGYPKFFADDEEVSKKDYLRLRRRRPELPAFLPAQDRRQRLLHPAFGTVWLRKEVRAALMRIPGDDDVVGCGAHR